MASTGRSSRSLRPLSSSQRSHNHHHHRRQRSPSPSNFILKLTAGNIPKPSTFPAFSNFPKRKCLCSPTTHPGSFRCAFHRREGIDKPVPLYYPKKRSNTTRSVRLNLWKLALINSLEKIGSVEAERFSRSLAASLVKPSSLHTRHRPEFRPRLSRFYVLDKDQD